MLVRSGEDRVEGIKALYWACGYRRWGLCANSEEKLLSVKKEPVPYSFFSSVYIQKASVLWPVRSLGWNVNYALTSGSWIQKGDKLPKWSKNCLCGETHVRERNHILRSLLRGNGCSLTGSSEKSKGIYFLLLKRCAFWILIRSSTL